MSGLHELEIDSDAAERAARACRDFADGMDRVLELVQRSRYSGGFGTLPSGIALEKKFTDLAIGEQGSLATMMRAHIDIGRRLADTFTEIGRKYDETDEGTAQSLRRK